MHLTATGTTRSFFNMKTVYSRRVDMRDKEDFQLIIRHSFQIKNGLSGNAFEVITEDT
jgi:hypothetical protein